MMKDIDGQVVCFMLHEPSEACVRTTIDTAISSSIFIGYIAIPYASTSRYVGCCVLYV